MSKIRILPEKVANQIAAGEVVERPASVVKELVENSIDAAAGRIIVQVEGDGTSLIRIIDDGIGMDQDDVLLCLERHATSKVAGEEDLAAIRTLGFRGEAMPSIASVSQLVITSRQRGASLGCRAEVRYGTVAKVHDMGCAEGTVMEVKNLFGNVPARRKFLKSGRTELAHVEETVVNCALANPAVAFRLHFGERMALDLPAAADDEGRVRAVLGLVPAAALIGLAGLEDEANPLGVTGFLLSPGSSEVHGLRLFVNRRPVRDRMLAHAVAEGMQGFLMKGGRSAGVVFVSLPATDVDVNVHPTKQEVRFRQPAALHKRVVEIVQAGLAAFQQNEGQRLFSPAPRPAPTEYPSAPAARPVQVSLAERAANPVQSYVAVRRRDDEEAFRLPPALPQAPPASVMTVSEEAAPFPAGEEEPPLRLIGQAFNSFIMLEDGDNLLVIDQHAAQERLLYEKLKTQLLSGSLIRQTLLFPLLIELTAVETQAAEQFVQEIATLGVELAEFGGQSFLIKAVPALLGHLDPLVLVRDILHGFSFDSRSGRGVERLTEIIANMACKAAIKANHRLHDAEMTALVSQMRAARVFSHCPHGRPVVRSFSRQQVGRWFERT